FVNGVATGRLLPPIMAAATKASWIRTFTEREGISLSDSYAYTDSMSDLPMLSIVGHPAVVNPDMRLRQTALHHDWPILNLKKTDLLAVLAPAFIKITVMALQLRKKTHESVIYIDRDSAPRIIPSGEDFIL